MARHRARAAVAEFRSAIDIAAPAEVVFDLLTSPEGLTSWMGEYAELDPQPGGGFAVDIAGHPVRGRYLVVEPSSRVVVSWGFPGSAELPVGASTVEFRLWPIDGGTRVELTHAGLPDSALPGHADGWAHFLPRLRGTALGEEPGPDTWRPLSDPRRTTMSSRPARDIVLDYHRAWTGGAVEAALALVAEDIRCRAPGVDLEGKAAYARFISGFAPSLTGLTDIAAFAHGDRVALFYYPETATTATAPAAECFTVRDGLIAESVLVFDRLSFAPPPEGVGPQGRA